MVCSRTRGFDRPVDSALRKRLQLQRGGPRANFRSRITPSPLIFARALQLIDPSRFMHLQNVLGRAGKTHPLRVRHCDRQYDVPGLGRCLLLPREWSLARCARYERPAYMAV